MMELKSIFIRPKFLKSAATEALKRNRADKNHPRLHRSPDYNKGLILFHHPLHGLKQRNTGPLLLPY